MILFTSDLDRTLIYSSRMIEAYPVLGRIRIVEKKEGKTISYMSEEAIKLLQSFHQEHQQGLNKLHRGHSSSHYSR